MGHLSLCGDQSKPLLYPVALSRAMKLWGRFVGPTSWHVLFVKVIAKTKHGPHGCWSCKSNGRQSVGVELALEVFKSHKLHILPLLYLVFAFLLTIMRWLMGPLVQSLWSICLVLVGFGGSDARIVVHVAPVSCSLSVPYCHLVLLLNCNVFSLSTVFRSPPLVQGHPLKVNWAPSNMPSSPTWLPA
jgi:hypothetical protein